VASRFRLEDLLEEHSGARFWRATDLTLARNVAIHVIPADDPRAAAVLTAARTSATVADGHILRVLDALQDDDLVHVVHEWGSGMSLDRLLAEETLEPRRAAWLVREVADAIAVAHRHGIAHGRLLPENVLLTDTGSVKLIGFVVDAVLHGRPQRSGDESEPPSEHESDVLNLGALLYACLTGKWPGFPESVLPDAPLDHDRVCRPRQVRPRVPKRLDALCDQIVNGEPRPDGRRFESAAQVSAALGDYLGDALTGATVAIAGAVSGPTTLMGPGGGQRPGTADRTAAPGGVDPEATQAGLPRLDTTETAERVVDPVVAPVVAPVTSPARPAAGTTGAPAPGGAVGGGAVPPYWGPDRPEAAGSWPVPAQEGRPGSTWLRLAAVLGFLLVLLVSTVFAFSLGSGGRSSDDPSAEPTPSPSSQQPVEPVEIAAVSAFDPDGGGPLDDENPELVPLTVDGDPATAWRTSTYFDGPVLAPFKSGVGLLLDLGRATEVSDVAVTLAGGPYDLQLLAAPRSASAPAGVAGLTTVDTVSGLSGRVELTGDDPVRTRFLVVWLTALPQVSGGFQGNVAEVVVRS
jgi:serine/threonine protein kinase